MNNTDAIALLLLGSLFLNVIQFIHLEQARRKAEHYKALYEKLLGRVYEWRDLIK